MHKNCCFRHGALSSSKWVFFPISYGGPSNMSIELGAQLNVGMQQSEAFKLHLSIRNQGYWPNILYIGWLVGCIKKEANISRWSSIYWMTSSLKWKQLNCMSHLLIENYIFGGLVGRTFNDYVDKKKWVGGLKMSIFCPRSGLKMST